MIVKEIKNNGVEYRMGLELESEGICHGGAGIVMGNLYKGVIYHLRRSDYDRLLSNLELFLDLFRVVEDSDVRYIEIMGMVLMSDNGFHWELVSRATDEK